MADRSVLVTGCSSGFGLGLAVAFRDRGWRVIAGVRDPSRAPQALSGVEVVTLDLASIDDIRSVARRIERLDCLVNNAGYALTGPFASYTAEQMRRSLEVNVIGPAQLVQALLPALARAQGRIINVSSIAGEIGIPMISMYCAAKHAIEGWSESLRHELVPHGVQVALVEPGGFRTRFADNMEWGGGEIAPGSIDDAQLGRYRAMQARRLARPGRDPAAVVDAIVGLAHMKTMPMRTRVGSDATLLRRLMRWLPERAALSVLGGLLRRRMTGKESA